MTEEEGSSSNVEVRERERERERFLRMEKMLKKPSPKNWNWSLRKATLGSPWMGFHHVHLLECPLLPQCLVNDLEPRCFAPRCAWCNWIFLSHGLPCGLNLPQNPILQTPEMSWHGFQSQSRVHCGGTIASHCLKRRHHSLHLITVVPVSSVNL